MYSIIFTVISSFKEHCLLFLIYLILNVADTLSGWAKARINNVESSAAGLMGIIKKMCGWIIILIGFLIPLGFQELGSILQVDLSITVCLGWFVLITLIVNEYRSILENLVEAGCDVPKVLIKGLEVASQKLEELEGKDE